MELKFVVPDMEKTFGTLEFAGEGKVTTQRVNGSVKVIGRTFHLYSSVQRADNIEVRIPGSAGEKKFGFEEQVKLVNPRIEATGYGIEKRGFTNYILIADDMEHI